MLSPNLFRVEEQLDLCPPGALDTCYPTQFDHTSSRGVSSWETMPWGSRCYAFKVALASEPTQTDLGP